MILSNKLLILPQNQAIENVFSSFDEVGLNDFNSQVANPTTQ
ncbi:hypothetical protein FDUTEX481_08620 [Tolypothrix sp. PCC 7601]|nr:hypothetical protein FDUTEX481_08620 [Tolypothrix sp. PCC 7601]BAY89771.1 hypothetical protein NIES3275_17740 [Microchaete diplosiphon NIES-3275]